MMINGLRWALELEATGRPNETSRVVFDNKLSGTDNQYSVGQTSGAGNGNTLYVMQAMGTTTTASKKPKTRFLMVIGPKPWPPICVLTTIRRRIPSAIFIL